MKVWALKDQRIGSSKQTVFLAHELSDDVIEKYIEYNSFISLPNCLKFKTTGVDFGKSDKVLNLKGNEYPDVIVFAGRRLAGIAIYLKKYILKKFKKKIKLVSILNPNYSFRYFDFVLLPQHDKQIKDKYNNIVRFEGSLCKINLNNIIDKKTEEYWQNNLKECKKPFFIFMVGGNTKNKKFNLNEFKELVRYISSFVKKQNGTLLVSTSRRTTDELIKIIENNLECDKFVYKWARNSLFNPYYYFIREGNIIFITGDSISMIAEIATAGKSMYVYVPEKSLESKHIAFCNSLINKKVIRRLDLSTDNIEEYEVKSINEIKRIADYIKLNLEEKR